MSKKLTHREFLDKLPDKIKDNFSFIGKYRSSDNFVYIRDSFGIIYKQKPYWLISGRSPGIGTSINKTDALQKIINNLFNRKLKIKSDYIGHEDYIIVEDNNGIKYKTTPANLKDGKFPIFKSSLDKKNTFIILAKKIHGEKYDYSEINPIMAKDKVSINCHKHGKFYQSLITHVNCGQGCPKCWTERRGFALSFTTEEFINKAKYTHNSKYDYSLTNYTTSNNKIDIICPVHGVFTQIANNHLRGAGCPECALECHISTGFSRTDWVNKFNIAKGDKQAIVYIIKCFDDNEEFIKIGKTFRNTGERLGRNPGKKFPYYYKEISIFEDSPDNIYKLEKDLHREYKEYKYTPLKFFKGQSECFNIKIAKNFTNYER